MILYARMNAQMLRIALACAVVLPFGPAPSPAASPLACRDVPELIAAYLRKHVGRRSLSLEVRERVGENFLRQIDSQRSLLLESEAERVRTAVAGSFDAVRGKNCGPLTAVHAELLGHHRAAEALVREIVGDEDYALDESATLILDPKERGHPKNGEEQRELLRNLVHFQVSNYLAGGQELPEARRRVAERYTRARRRWAEQDREDLYAIYLDSFARALDPHSGYLSADDLEDFQIGMQLSLEGIGVALSERDGYAVVEQVIPGGAADRLDVLRPKDKIIAVADDGGEPVDVIDMALREVVRLIRGKKGSRVRLTVLRQEETAERFEVAIVRDKISLEEQAAKLTYETLEVEDRKLKLAVLDLPSFYGDRDPSKRQCSRDVADILRQVKEEKADGLLLDLSRNGGGLLDDAVRISGFFIREGGVVAIKDAGSKTRVLPDPDDGTSYTGPMVVLTSRVSASASEILAGALKDYRRALIVGDAHTFGKGTVQSVIPLRPGLGAMRVTTALFFRPGGVSTQNSGVEADVALPSLFEAESFGESSQPYSLPSATIEPFRGELANHDEGPKRWDPIDEATVQELVRRSSARVEKHEEFQEIRERIAEREQDDGVIELAEILREREESSSAEPTPEGEAGDEERTSPHLEEALRILADLVVLES